MESVVDSASTASEVSGSSGGSPRVKAASPARALSPPQLLAPRLPLPPPGLGLLGSLQMMHHSPLELMAAAHHHGPPRYGSPPPISTSDPSANECKLVDYRGQKVAAFIIQGDTMLCLPQAFELFLKHLVGGLHTVYTKLKRLDIVPLVCNVEQVRILRGLGAIQPGVNRCKLLSCKDFDVLYRDCTTARCLSMKAPDSSRPGRPPKRASGVGLSLAATQFPGHPFKKHRLENGDYSPYENGHMSEIARMEKSPLLANGYNAPPTHLGPMGFMHQHALMSPGMPHHGVPRPDGSIIKGQPMHNMEALARSGIWENCRAAYEDIVKHLERLRDERGDIERVIAMDKAREGSHNGSSPGHSPVLNLSKSGSGGDRERNERSERDRGERGEGSASGRSSAASRRTPQPPRLPSTATAAASPRSHTDESDAALSDQDEHNVKDEDDGADLSDGERDLPASTSPAPVSYSAPVPTSPSVPVDPTADTLVSSTETLLRNIQGLLKVAADNARQQERQISYEKAELKMDVLREREVKDNLERQLLDEQKMRVMYQKRLKKERKQRQQIQEQLEMELKRRQKVEEALKQSGAPAEILRIVTENLTLSTQENRSERENGSESKPPSTEPPTSSPPFQRDPPRTPDKPQWNYPPPPVDIMSGGAAFWQNYSESLAQELEMERKSRQQAMERDVKSPLSERASYYKNSVLFSSAT